MKDDSNVPADVVLFATGCQSGIDKIRLEKDGTTFSIYLCAKMLDHFIFPDFLIFQLD